MADFDTPLAFPADFAFAETPAPPPPVPNTRIPHFGHVLLFLLLLILSFIACELAGLALAYPHAIRQLPVNPSALNVAVTNQKLQLIVNAAAYGVTLVAAWVLFPLLWKRPLQSGLRWNAAAIRPRLLGLGFILSIASQATSTRLPRPDKMPIEDLFRTPGLIYILIVFGTLVAPLFEEIFFRGFLLPALAIAVDYLRLPRPSLAQAAQEHASWQASERFSTAALAVASLLTSLLFALIHAPQLGHSWPSVALLFAVSLVLCAVRLHFKSLAASTLVHAVYNGSVFITLAVATQGFRHLDRI